MRKCEYKSSSEKIGEFGCLEHRDNPEDKILVGRFGFIAYFADKLADHTYSDKFGDQIFYSSISKLKSLAKHLDIPMHPGKQLSRYRVRFMPTAEPAKSLKINGPKSDKMGLSIPTPQDAQNMT